MEARELSCGSAVVGQAFSLRVTFSPAGRGPAQAGPSLKAAPHRQPGDGFVDELASEDTSLPRCIIFNKPYGVPSQFSDPAGEFGRTLRDYVSVPEVYPVGRLDRDSEGLLLLTDDGRLQHQLTEPRFEHPKTYLVQVEGTPKDSDLESLRRGVVIQGRRTLPSKARALSSEPELWPRDPPIRFRKSIPTSWLEIILREGRNRQIRHMTAAVGLPTLRLVRWALGPLTVEGLDPGEWRELGVRDFLELKQMILGRKPGAGGSPGK